MNESSPNAQRYRSLTSLSDLTKPVAMRRVTKVAQARPISASGSDWLICIISSLKTERSLMWVMRRVFLVTSECEDASDGLWSRDSLG